MSEYVIITDAAADLSSELAEKCDVTVIPMTFNINGKEYYYYPGSNEMDTHEFYENLRQGNMSTTSAINIATYIDTFEPYLKKGLDILTIGFSASFSTCYGILLLAAAELREKYPERKIYCVDSLCASMGQALLVYLAGMKRLSGAGIDEVNRFVLEKRDHIAHWFTVEDLNHLKRGGRLPAAIAVAGILMGIKPVLYINEEGHIVKSSAVRGRTSSLAALVDNMEKNADPPEGQLVFIGHADSPEDAKKLEQMIRERVKTKEIYISDIGPIIGSHVGPGTLGLFFLEKQK